MLQLEDYHYERDKRYCLDQFKAYLLFESPFKDLTEEILERRINKSCFQDEELQSILESGVMGLKFFKQIGHMYESLSSSSVLISREGITVLSDPWFNSYENMPLGDRAYMSPEKLEAMKNMRTSRVDWYTSGLFALGMVVVEAANLEYLDTVYEQNRRINY